MNKTIGIFCAGQWGDCGTISSVLRYRKELWGDCKIIWFIEDRNRDLLKYQDVELRTFPRGFGYPEMVKEENQKLIDAGKEPVWEDWSGLVDENNHLDIEKAKAYPSLVGIDVGYFPAPHQMSIEKRHDLTYPNCSKKVFGVPYEWPWHPVLKFSDDERVVIRSMMYQAKKKKCVAIETLAGSGQSILSDEQIRKTMQICIDILGDCNFWFMSHKYLNGNEEFPEDLTHSFPLNIHSDRNIFFGKGCTVRECALIVGKCDILISVSSGITVASSCWGNNPVPILQFCGSEKCGTRTLSLGKYELVTHDLKNLQVAQNEYYSKLTSLLKEIQ